jgi:hypothetical protein
LQTDAACNDGELLFFGKGPFNAGKKLKPYTDENVVYSPAFSYQPGAVDKKASGRKT